MRLRYSSEARRDRRDAESYYQSVSPRARLAFRGELQAAVQYVITYPLGAPVHAYDVRGKRLQHFPYTILYRVHEGRIFVLAIAHQARDPEYYANRFG